MSLQEITLILFHSPLYNPLVRQLPDLFIGETENSGLLFPLLLGFLNGRYEKQVIEKHPDIDK